MNTLADLGRPGMMRWNTGAVMPEDRSGSWFVDRGLPDRASRLKRPQREAAGRARARVSRLRGRLRLHPIRGRARLFPVDWTAAEATWQSSGKWADPWWCRRGWEDVSHAGFPVSLCCNAHKIGGRGTAVDRRGGAFVRL